jgi:metal transporter CNNM
MADISGGLYGFLISTFAIVIFGEIIPQATCSRYPLEIGNASLPITKV